MSQNCDIFPSRDRKGAVAPGTERSSTQALPNGRGSVWVSRTPARSLTLGVLIGIVIAAWGLSGGMAAPAAGQCLPEWSRRVDVPEQRRDAVMVFDSWRGVAVMIGGWIGPNDAGTRYVWEWDGIKWTRRDVIGPTERLSEAEMAFDSARGVTVLQTRVQRVTETWEYDGVSWALVSTGGPQLGGARTMAFDVARGVTLLWGERGIGTWSWDGSDWTFLTAEPQPEQSALAMAYDAGREVVVMFGWADGLATTYEWNGKSWTRVALGGPPLRFGHTVRTRRDRTRHSG